MASEVTTELVDVVRPAMSALLELANAGQGVGAAGLPAADSRAMAELAEEQGLANAHLREPVHAAHSLAGIVAFAATDHLRNYARLFGSQPVPVYSHLVLARACLDACSLAFWMSDPAIGTLRRTQRYLVLRLHNAKQQKRSPLEVAKNKGRRIIDEVKAGVATAGWPIHAHVNDGQSPRIGGEEMPSSKKGIAAVLGDMPEEAEKVGLGPVLWWYLSGVTHSASYGLMQAVELQEGGDSFGPQLGAISTDAKSVILMAWAIATAYVTVTEARRRLFGWESAAWNAAVTQQRKNFEQFKNLV